nr:zinc-dependent alcohol dehydrogenase family protein [Nevskia soli]
MIRIRAAGLCHSDLSVIDGSRPRIMPMVMGHEGAGEVVECGPDVVGLRPGDLVVLSFVPSCGHCGPCASGRPALCEPGAGSNTAGTLLTGSRRWHLNDGSSANHHLGVSAFAEMAVVSARSAIKVDSSLRPEIAALFGCAVLTGVGAAVNTAQIRPGESAAVFGLGGVGLAAVLGAKAAGANPLIAVDVLQSKLDAALELGATSAINARDHDVVAAIRDMTGGGVHHAIETVGSEAVLAQAYSVTCRGGTTVTAGLPHPHRMFSVPAVSLVAEERTVKGSYMGSAVPSRDIPRYIDLYRAGLLPVDRLLTHRLRLDDINEAFDRLSKGAAIRQIVEFD